jgi:DNA-binding protein H-NS
MAKTLAQIQKQIASLQKEADAIKAKEMVGVIERIRDAVGHYGLTVEHLFGINTEKAAKGKRAKVAVKQAAGKKAAPAPSAAKGKKVAIKYRDGDGNTWTGRGSQPRWLKAAVAGGKQVEDFAVESK